MIILHEHYQLEQHSLVVDKKRPHKISNELVGRQLSCSFQREGEGGLIFHAFDVGTIESVTRNTAGVVYGHQVYNVKLLVEHYVTGEEYKPTTAGKWRLLVAKR